jgi:hypothetical protein
MRIEKRGEYFVIARGRAHESFFCFFVDDTGSCWTCKSYSPDARRFGTMRDAATNIGELKRRAHLRKTFNC